MSYINDAKQNCHPNLILTFLTERWAAYKNTGLLRRLSPPLTH